jgi:hypothetical protein
MTLRFDSNEKFEQSAKEEAHARTEKKMANI